MCSMHRFFWSVSPLTVGCSQDTGNSLMPLIIRWRCQSGHGLLRVLGAFVSIHVRPRFASFRRLNACPWALVGDAFTYLD